MESQPTDWKKRWHTRDDSGLRLDRDGRWWHDEELIEHPKIIEAFNQGLRPTEDGRFRLEFGNDWCFVQVEDAAYRVLSLHPERDHLSVELSDRTTEPFAAETLRLDERGIFICRVKAGRAWARFTREAQAALGEQLVEREGKLGLNVGKTFIPLAIDPSGLPRTD